jgi:flagellar biosynthesis/type III secretory pathway protein FliH
MTSSSNRSARVLRPEDATVVARVPAEHRRVHHDAPHAPSWTPEELDGLDLSFPPPAHASEPAAESGPSLDLIAAELELAREEAYARGLEEGRSAGALDERARLATAAAAAREAIALVHEGERRWVGNAEENVVAIATAIARHIIAREVASDDSLMRALVARALSEFPIAQAVTVRVNPADLGALTGAEAASLAGAREEIVWTGDARVGRGGCVVEGRDRIIDGRVDTALERLYRRLSGNNA